ncbi:hypothetical protein BH11PSE11_BH11PSE11_20090 [soil metagenome]
MSLLITQDGSVKYDRLQGGGSKSLTGPLKKFDGNHFDVGFGPFSTTFVVTAPPHMVGNAMKIMVDGVELVRTE